MGHYKANLRDIEFNLFEVFGRGAVLGTGAYEDVDAATAHEILTEVGRLAEDELAASLQDSDAHPPVFDPATHSVTLPESFKASYQAYLDAEWWRMDVPAELGGTVVPPSLRWAVAELVLGSNPAVHMYSSGFAFAHTMYRLGTEEQKVLAGHMVEEQWGSTMVLTEPDAGSDVGAGRAKAVQQPDGTWHVTGVKRFITSAAHDLADNVVHLVLARPEGAGPGTKGLSLFVVPAFHVDLATGALGERNGAFVTNVEHKMGLKVSTTCEVRFGEVGGVPAVGTLLGGVHDGIAQMFKIIEYARMMVGTKAIATLSTGYLNALDYAKTRVQGADLLQMADKAAPRVTITHHPDVRRSLMTQKAYAEGMRALITYTATFQDAVDVAEREGRHRRARRAGQRPAAPAGQGLRLGALVGAARHREPADLRRLRVPVRLPGRAVRPRRQDRHPVRGDDGDPGPRLLLPQDRPRQGPGARLRVRADPGVRQGGRRLRRAAAERDLLARAVDDVQGIVGTMVGALDAADPRSGADADPRNVYLVGQNTSRLLLAAGDLVVGWLLLRQAEVALAALGREGLRAADRDFYTGKVAAARFFARTVLPRLTAERRIAETVDNGLMDLPESAF